MDRRKKVKGSITLYLCLSLLCILLLLFALLESVRYHGLMNRGEQLTKVLVESYFGNYSPLLWKDAKVLFLDGRFQGEEFSLATGEERLKNLLREPLKIDQEQTTLVNLEVKEIEILSYSLATDEQGGQFVRHVADRMKGKVLASAVDKIYKELISSEQHQEEVGESLETLRVTAQTAINQILEEATELKPSTFQTKIDSKGIMQEDQKEEKQSEEDQKEQEDEKAGIEIPYNPIDIVQEKSSTGILALVLPKEQISQRSSEEENWIKNRKLQVGNSQEKGKIGWYEKILFGEYVLLELSSYQNSKKNTARSYQLEYLVGGKEVDEQNLEQVVNQLLGVREISNYLYLLKDEEKKAQALVLASGIAGALASPQLTQVIHQGILAAWAFGESVVDVRALLEGKKVPLMKEKGDWSSDLYQIGENMTGEKDHDKGQKGNTYEQYIRSFLFLLPIETLSYRTMDVIEEDANAAGEPLRMDQMIGEMRICCTYQAKPLFYSFFSEQFKLESKYEWSQEGEFSYVTR